jgi:hypothetical protein
MSEGRKQIETPGYTGPERRKNLPTMELWQENIKALNRCQVSNCQMRYALTAEELAFLMRFEDQIPIGHLHFVFPEIDREKLVAEGWNKFVLTLSINDEGKLSVHIRGRYERDGVPLDVSVEFTRDIGTGVGVENDTVSFIDARDESRVDASLAEIIEVRLKSGDRKYARKDDEVSSVSVEGMVNIIARYLKDSAVRRRILPQPTTPQNPPPPGP